MANNFVPFQQRQRSNGRGGDGRHRICLTAEQRAVTQVELRPSEVLKVNPTLCGHFTHGVNEQVLAYAGSGKTTTLAEYARLRPSQKFLYIA